jgi:hypothetical protein
MTSTPMFSNMLDPKIDQIFAKLCVNVEHALLPGLVNDVEQHVAQARDKQDREVSAGKAEIDCGGSKIFYKKP